MRILTLTMVTVVAALVACKVQNPNHCIHQDLPPNQWCQQEYEMLPFCSPCEAQDNGCTQNRPMDCSDYSDDPTTGAGTTGSGSSTSTSAGPGTGTSSTGGAQ